MYKFCKFYPNYPKRNTIIPDINNLILYQIFINFDILIF